MALALFQMGRPPHSHHRASRPDTTASTKMNAAAAATTFAWSTFAAPLRLPRHPRRVETAPARALPRSARAEASFIDGKAIAADVREEVRVGVAQMKEKIGKVPGA